jgi:hypothetical protein
MSPDHLIEYWSILDGQTVHPDDQLVLPPGEFAIDLQPLPWNGPLRSARAYILLLNPGLNPTDHEYERLMNTSDGHRFKRRLGSISRGAVHIFICSIDLPIVRATSGLGGYSAGT